MSWKVSTSWSSRILSICSRNWPNAVLRSVERLKGGITAFLVISSVVCCGVVSGREGSLCGKRTSLECELLLSAQLVEGCEFSFTPNSVSTVSKDDGL